jgi:hypothetical protein
VVYLLPEEVSGEARKALWDGCDGHLVERWVSGGLDELDLADPSISANGIPNRYLPLKPNRALVGCEIRLVPVTVYDVFHASDVHAERRPACIHGGRPLDVERVDCYPR